MFNCNQCDLVFSSNKALLTHLNKSNAHKEKLVFTCDLCKTTFESDQKLKVHIQTCELKQQIKSLTKENKHLNEQKQTFEKQNIVLEEKVKLLNDLIDKKEERIKELQQVNVTVQYNQVNNQININQSSDVNYKNIVDRLPPVKLKELEYLFNSFPANTFESYESFTKFISNDYLKYRVICTDLRRKTLAWKDENRNIIKDKEGRLLSQTVKNIGKKNHKKLDAIAKELASKLDYTNISQAIRDSTSSEFRDVFYYKDDQHFQSNFIPKLVKRVTNIKNINNLPNRTFVNIKLAVNNYFDHFKSIDGFDPTNLKSIEELSPSLSESSDDNSLKQRLTLTEFLLLMFKNCFRMPSHHAQFMSLYTCCVSKIILVFIDCCYCYFCDDAENVYPDIQGNVLIQEIYNQLKNPSRLNYLTLSKSDLDDLSSLNCFKSLFFELAYRYTHDDNDYGLANNTDILTDTEDFVFPESSSSSSATDSDDEKYQDDDDQE